MRLMGRFCLQSCFYVLLVVLALGTMINQKPSYGGIKPGVYDITIKTSPVENKHDTWE